MLAKKYLRKNTVFLEETLIMGHGSYLTRSQEILFQVHGSDCYTKKLNSTIKIALIMFEKAHIFGNK